MKKIYTISIVLSFVVFLGCSKDFLKKYDRRIVGTWEIADINRVGLGGNIDNLPFRDGTFIFNEDGSLQYINTSGDVYEGRWDITKKIISEETLRSLEITAIDFTSQRVLTESYDDMNFVGTDHFKANINSGFHAYVTHFRR
jgi:hypothetical protein